MDKFKAGMVLGAVGDALGFKKGRWEGCISGKSIQEELASLGGLGALKLDPDNWPVSDATLMLMTTAEALITGTVFIKGHKNFLGTGQGSRIDGGLLSIIRKANYFLILILILILQPSILS